MQTTYIDRSNSNANVFERCQHKMDAEEGENKTIVTFREAYRRSRMKRMAKIITNRKTITHKTTQTNNTHNQQYTPIPPYQPLRQ